MDNTIEWRYDLHRVTPQGLVFEKSFDAPEKAMGHADADADVTYPEWRLGACGSKRVWTRDHWYIQEEKAR